MPRGRLGDLSEVDVAVERDRARVDLEDLLAALGVGRLDEHAPIEAPGPQQSGVEHVGPVGRAEHDHADRRVEPVHLGEDLVERLLALVVTADDAAAAAAGAADRVQLVDEDDRRGGLLGLLEQVAHARGADADDRLDELRRRRREERHAGLAGDGAREQRLARAGRAGQQDAARDARAELGVLLRVLEEVDHLDELLLGLVDARDVVEVDGLGLRLDALGARAPELAEHPSPARPGGGAPEQEDEQRDDQDRRAEGEQDRLEQRAAVRAPPR